MTEEIVGACARVADALETFADEALDGSDRGGWLPIACALVPMRAAIAQRMPSAVRGVEEGVAHDRLLDAFWRLEDSVVGLRPDRDPLVAAADALRGVLDAIGYDGMEIDGA